MSDCPEALCPITAGESESFHLRRLMLPKWSGLRRFDNLRSSAIHPACRQAGLPKP